MQKIISLRDASFLVVGLARDCERQLVESFAKLSESILSAKTPQFLIIESDSSDRTVDVLRNLSLKNKNFNYVSLGHIREQYPKRTDRLAFCRNHYLELIKASSDYQEVDYVVIADLDGANAKLSSDAVASCWSRVDWDVCTANQDGPYYDIWALRHPSWSPNDCWEQVEFLMSNGLSRFKSIFSSVYSRMIRLNSDAGWVEVDSAFGGLAIYRKTALMNVKYMGLTKNGVEICEHVSLHQQIRENGGRIFINPKMLNAGVVGHARSATGLGLVRFWFKCQFKDMACYLRILPVLEKARKVIGVLLG